MDIQSRWLAAVVDDRVVLPSTDQMQLAIVTEQTRSARLYPDRPRYGLELDPREYGLAIRADLGATTNSVAQGSQNPQAPATLAGGVGSTGEPHVGR
jgi:hypothetical protein